MNNFNDSQDVIWSGDGSRVVFTTANNLWTAHPDGTGLTALTNLTLAQSFADAFSPDGTKLTFTSTRALDGSDNAQDRFNLWIMNADGTNPKPLTRLTVVGAADGV